MSNFVIECPVCGAMHQASNSLFSKKTIKCSCGRVIDIRKDSLVTDDCPHCGNKIVVDARKGDKAICPVCKKPVHTNEDLKNLITIRCPQCACEIHAKKPEGGPSETVCPICEARIDVLKAYERQKATDTNLISVLKYEGDNDTLIWKHPIEDFNAGSQLIVHESQVAVFFRDGIALDTFPSGNYTLNTKTLPLIGGAVKIPSEVGIDTVFHSEVYFVNTVTHLSYKWGTPSRIRLIDPVTNMHVDIGARGSMNIRITDARKLLTNLVGTNGTLTREDLQGSTSQQPALANFFRDIIVARVRTYLSNTIKNEKINIMEIDARLDEISVALQAIINESLEEFGFALHNFLIMNVDLPEDNEAFMELKKLHDEQILELSRRQATLTYIKADAELEYAEKEKVNKLKTMEATNEAEVARISVERARAEAEKTIAEAQGEAERIRLEGSATASAYSSQAQAEAEEMRSKGYTYTQETSRQIGLEAMQNGLPGTGNGGGSGAGGTVSSAVGDMIGLGVTLGAVGSVAGMARDTMAPIMQDVSQIGKQVNGAVAGGWNCACGKNGITSNFCPECGAQRPIVNAGWNCTCGSMNITSKFCPECGKMNPALDVWECKNCGTKDIKSKFCPNCGHQREV